MPIKANVCCRAPATPPTRIRAICGNASCVCALRRNSRSSRTRKFSKFGCPRHRQRRTNRTERSIATQRLMRQVGQQKKQKVLTNEEGGGKIISIKRNP